MKKNVVIFPKRPGKKHFSVRHDLTIILICVLVGGFLIAGVSAEDVNDVEILEGGLPGDILSGCSSFSNVKEFDMLGMKDSAGVDATGNATSDGNIKVKDVNYQCLSSGFIPNAGQYDPDVEFVLQYQGTTVFFTMDGLVLTHTSGSAENISRDVIRQSFAGASEETYLTAQGQRTGVVNYYCGNESSQWFTDLPVYSEIVYENLYPGIDLAYSENNGKLKREFRVSPGADPSGIGLLYEGEDDPFVDQDGVLRFQSPAGEMIESPLVCWQEINGEIINCKGDYVTEDKLIHIQIYEYDQNYELIIDPDLVYSSYFGGDDEDSIIDISTDGSGGIWIGGWTGSSDFPQKNSFQNKCGNYEDAFVSHFSSDGNLISSTYLGGGDAEDVRALAPDNSGGVWVAGSTMSSDFPVLNGCQDINGGNYYEDVFVSHFSSVGNILSSTYLGGGETDSVYGIVTDDAGGSLVVGSTSSSDFPVINAYQDEFGGSYSEVFISHFSSNGNLLFSTYFGGNDCDSVHSIVSDGFGGIWVGGSTESSNFPVKNAFQDELSGSSCDGFVSHFSSNGVLLFSTYLGGQSYDYLSHLASDGSGGVWGAGYTTSSDFPIKNAFRDDPNGGSAFVTHFSSTGILLSSTFCGVGGADGAYALIDDGSGGVWVAGHIYCCNYLVDDAVITYGGGGIDIFLSHVSATGCLLSSTYFGGSGEDVASVLALDGSGGVWISGDTMSSDFPIQDAYHSEHGADCYDTFLTHFSSEGTLQSSTYLGENNYEYIDSLVSDGHDSVWMAGSSCSSDFPVVNAYQCEFGGVRDAVVSKFFDSGSTLNSPIANYQAEPLSGTAPLTVQFTDQSTGNPDSYYWDFGDGNTSTEINPENTYSTDGYYDVSLTVTNADGTDTNVKNQYVAVFNDNPQNEFEVTAYYCAFDSESEGRQTIQKTISGNSYTLNASFLYGGKGVPMQGTGRTGPTGDYIHLTNPSDLAFVHINNPLEFTDVVKKRYADLGITDFTGFGNLAINQPNLASFSVILEYSGARGTALDSWHSIAVDRSLIPLGTSGVLLFNGGQTTPDGSSTMVFCADDTGGDIKGRNIDVYVGEGNEAMQKWWETGGNRNAKVSIVPVPVKTADFTADVTSGTDPLTVQFTDRSTGEPSSYLWDFGDDTTSTDPNPVHTYTQLGTFDVSLTVDGDYGSDTKEKSEYIEVFAPPEGTVTVSKSGNVDDATSTWKYPTNYNDPVFRRGVDNPTFIVDLNGDIPKDCELLFEIYCPDYCPELLGSVCTDEASGVTWKWADIKGNDLNFDSLPIGVYRVDAFIVDPNVQQTKYEIGSDIFYVIFNIEEQDCSFVTLDTEQCYVKADSKYIPRPPYNLHIYNPLIWKPALTEASGSTCIDESVEQISELARKINGEMVFHHTESVEKNNIWRFFERWI